MRLREARESVEPYVNSIRDRQSLMEHLILLRSLPDLKASDFKNLGRQGVTVFGLGSCFEEL